jgi:hypothetical protein
VNQQGNPVEQNEPNSSPEPEQQTHPDLFFFPPNNSPSWEPSPREYEYNDRWEKSDLDNMPIFIPDPKRTVPMPEHNPIFESYFEDWSPPPNASFNFPKEHRH